MKYLILFLSQILAFSVHSKSNQWEGQPFPSFELKNQHNNLMNNQSFSDKWVVYYFYPKDKTPGCTVEAKNFTQDYPKYKKLNIEIVGISYDDVESHKDFAETYEMPFYLLADTEKVLSKKLGVDRFLPWPHPSRQTFLVNNKGIIIKHYESVDPDSHSQQILTDIPNSKKNQKTIK